MLRLFKVVDSEAEDSSLAKNPITTTKVIIGNLDKVEANHINNNHSKHLRIMNSLLVSSSLHRMPHSIIVQREKNQWMFSKDKKQTSSSRS